MVNFLLLHLKQVHLEQLIDHPCPRNGIIQEDVTLVATAQQKLLKALNRVDLNPEDNQGGKPDD